MSNPSDTTQPEKSETPAATPGTESSDGAVVILFFIFGLAASMVLGWVIFPTLLYSKKKQPVDFNHTLHVAEVENGCQSCHFFREDGTFSGSPTLESCVTCHESVQGATEEEARFVSQYVEKNREVPWLVYAGMRHSRNRVVKEPKGNAERRSLATAVLVSGIKRLSGSR